MSDREMQFPEMSNYPKNSDTAMSVDTVEAWLDQFPHKRAENKPNGGIVLSVVDTRGMMLRELSRSTIIKKLKYLEDKGFISKKHNHAPNGNIKESTYTINESIFN